MDLHLDDEEEQFLAELLEEKHKRMIQELDHTDTIAFERMLKKKLEVLEGIKLKVGTPAGAR